MLLFLFSTLYYGLPYYLLDSEQRGGSPLNAAMRPSGSIGIRLGFLGLGIFLLLFLYPIRKRWPWLGRKGKTKHWLDFHVLLGVSAPIVITLHSSFKLRGLAGLAYWIMMAVALSGVVGRYLFSQIPRSMTTAELSFQDMEEQLTRFSAQMRSQSLLSEAEIAPLLRLPSREEVDALSLMGALWRILQLDLTRPFQVAVLRRRFLTAGGQLLTLGGLLPSPNAELEGAIAAVRAQSWLSTKMLFLSRLQELFRLWHVVHRPFSYSFVVLVIVHITVAMLFGYY